MITDNEEIKSFRVEFNFIVAHSVKFAVSIECLRLSNIVDDESSDSVPWREEVCFLFFCFRSEIILVGSCARDEIVVLFEGKHKHSRKIFIAYK